MSAPMSPERLAEIAVALETYQTSHGPNFACCSAHAVADAAPALLAEVERLHAALAERTAQFADAAAGLAEQVQRNGKRQREHFADREEVERLRTELAARPSAAAALRDAGDRIARKAAHLGGDWIRADQVRAVLHCLADAAKQGESGGAPDPLAYGPTGYRCGCGADAHSNLTPCRADDEPGGAS